MKAKTKSKVTRTVATIPMDGGFDLKIQNTGDVIETYNGTIMKGADILKTVEAMEAVAAAPVVSFELPQLISGASIYLTDNSGHSIRGTPRDRLLLRIGCQAINLETARNIAASVRKQLDRK